MRLNIDFERMKEIYGDEIVEIINENIDIIEKNIRFLNDLKFEDAEGIFEMYPDLFMNFPKKFEEKILKLKDLMLTDSGKEESKNRHQIVVDFLYHLFNEENAPEWIEYLNNYLK